MRRAAVAIASLALCAIGAEAAFWLGSTVAAPPAVAGRCAVLVLGYPSHADGSPNAVQRSRVAAGALAFANHHCERMVISGGAAHNASIEAAVMARLAIVTRVRTLHERLRGRAYPGLRQSLRLTPEGRHISHLPNALALGLIDAFAL